MTTPTTPAMRRKAAASAAREARRALYAATRTIDEAIRECTARFATGTGQDMARAAADFERAIEPFTEAARVLWRHSGTEPQ